MRVPRSRLARVATCALVGVAVWLAWSGSRGPSLRRATLHPIDDEVVVDLGALADHAPRAYRVQPGDILGRIAQREVGSVRDVARILALNPGLDPDHLKAGTTLRLPPRGGAAKGYAFYLWSGELRPVDHAARAAPLPAPAELLALPLHARKAGEAALRRASAFEEGLPAVPELRRGPTLEPLAQAPAEDETVRVVHHVRVQGVTQEGIQADVSVQRLDAKGRTVTPIDSEGARFGRTLLLGLLTLVVIGAVLLVARRLEGGGSET